MLEMTLMGVEMTIILEVTKSTQHYHFQHFEKYIFLSISAHTFASRSLLFSNEIFSAILPQVDMDNVLDRLLQLFTSV